MRIGFICEGTPDSPDVSVFSTLALKVNPDLERVADSFVTLQNKPLLIQDCGRAARQLLDDGCDRVLILWDLFPAWRSEGEKPCRKEDRNAVIASLRRADLTFDDGRIRLLCIREELETWLLADKGALASVLSTKAHPVSANRLKTRQPERTSNPKKVLRRFFQAEAGRQFNEGRHPGEIAREINPARLCRLDSFRRFQGFLLAET